MLTVCENNQLANFLGSSQAAPQNHIDQEELCDNLFKSLTCNIKTCKYFDADCQFINSGSGNALMLMHINIRSLHKNFDLLHEFISMLNFIPHIICISETRIKKHPLINVNLMNYSFLHVDSATNARGVAMYIHSSIKFEASKRQYQLTNSETFWIDLSDSSGLTYVVGVIYRHPSYSDVDNFIEDLAACLADLNNHKQTFYLLGDININISADNRSSVANRYLNMLVSSASFPLITSPTRITETSTTVIDHIITNDSKHSIVPGVSIQIFTAMT